LVQDLLVRMLGNITACECMALRLSQMNMLIVGKAITGFSAFVE
jgi:hypothetical protein